MVIARRSELRACGIAATILGIVLWPSNLPVSESSLVAGAPAAATLWLAPAVTSRTSPLATAIEDLSGGYALRALPVLSRAVSDRELGGYAQLYLGRSQLTLQRISDATSTASKLAASHPTGYLGEASLWLSADVAEAAGDSPSAIRALLTLTSEKSLEPEQAWLRLGQARANASDRAGAIEALRKVYYSYPLTPEAITAGARLTTLLGSSEFPSRETLPLDLGRAEALYAARRYTDARAAFMALRPIATDADGLHVDLRVSECEYFLKRFASARDALLRVAERVSPEQLEARFFYFSSLRELDRDGEYLSMARAFVDEHPDHPLAETTLNDLGTYYTVNDEDEKAAAVLAELYEKYPTGTHAPRAAWRAGWWAYKSGKYGETIRLFESAEVAFPHDDYRPLWLFWSARARAKQNDRQGALDGYRRVVESYRNSYYGRLAVRSIGVMTGPRSTGADQISPPRQDLPPSVLPGDVPSNAGIIRALLAAGLYTDAIYEVRKTQLESGTSPLLEATIAYALNRRGDLRPAITAMRRAYPQFIAEGGEALPDEIRRVIFPVAFSDLISREAAERHLDPYLMLALVAQESTFQADVRSSANAWGLMQIAPATGRQYATKLRIRPFSTARLRQPEVNVQIGMASFADRLQKFGSVAKALAAYNAGDSRVARWVAERPADLPQDEFIDDIPFPETQNYVKRILGTAEDYRLLYSELRIKN